jgi:hypothetical protein
MYELPNSYPQALMALTPGAQWSMTNDNDYSTLIWYSTDVEKPTQEVCDAEIASLNANQPLTNCKDAASKLLYQTDWTTIPDVANPINNPYLLNQAEYIAYRNILRGLAVNPVADPVFPPQPTSQWSS